MYHLGWLYLRVSHHTLFLDTQVSLAPTHVSLLVILLNCWSQDRVMLRISCHCWSQKGKTTLCYPQNINFGAFSAIPTSDPKSDPRSKSLLVDFRLLHCPPRFVLTDLDKSEDLAQIPQILSRDFGWSGVSGKTPV